jgi:two-component system, sensor histidine kinase and response regulator
METKGRILIIDDEEGIRKGCMRVLHPAGYEIEAAATFHEGLEKIQAGGFDLVLLDVMMPDGRGIDLLEPIRQRDPDAVAVLITGYATVELAVDAIKRGAYDFIAKPFTAQMLFMTVEQGLEKRRLSTEARRLRAVQAQFAELEQARDQAEKLSELKSRFATMVAHELRAPIGASQSLVKTVLRGLAGELNPKQSELLGRVEVRLDTLLKLVNDLLTLAASKSLAQEKPLAPVNIQAVVERVLQTYGDQAAAKGVSLQQVAAPFNGEICATEDGLETIVGNLVCNAVKYTPAGGSVRVELKSEGEWECAVLSVADTGIGIPEPELARIGDEFFRGSNARAENIEGTGLGMSIVRELLNRFSAQIDINSQAGRGTSVTLRFPLLAPQHKEA